MRIIEGHSDVRERFFLSSLSSRKKIGSSLYLAFFSPPEMGADLPAELRLVVVVLLLFLLFFLCPCGFIVSLKGVID